MLASLLIIVFSLILLVYWFRYTCLLLLHNSQSELPAAAREDARLNYRQVQNQLQQGVLELDPLQQALSRDYAILTYVIEHATGLNLNPVERHLLTADYRMMAFWYRLARTVSPAAARRAVEEMALVVSVLSQRMDSQSAG